MSAPAIAGQETADFKLNESGLIGGKSIEFPLHERRVNKVMLLNANKAKGLEKPQAVGLWRCSVGFHASSLEEWVYQTHDGQCLDDRDVQSGHRFSDEATGQAD